MNQKKVIIESIKPQIEGGGYLKRDGIKNFFSERKQTHQSNEICIEQLAKYTLT